MNWFKQNPFLSGLLAVVVVAAGVLGYMIFGKSSELDLLNQEYAAKVTQLQDLQGRTPFPSQKNVDATDAVIKQYAAAIQAFRDQLVAFEPAVPEISPEAFQDRLRLVVSEVETRASKSGTKLPDNFYMGFDTYKTTLPSPKAAGLLARQLNVILSAVNRLLDLKVESIAGVVRQPLPEESTGAAAPAPPAGGRPPAAPSTPLVVKSAFDLAFRADQAKVRQAVNSIVTSTDVFLILRGVLIENSDPNPPSRKDKSATPNAPTPSAAQIALGVTGGEPGADALRVVVGREAVLVEMQLEMVDFNIPEVKL